MRFCYRYFLKGYYIFCTSYSPFFFNIEWLLQT